MNSGNIKEIQELIANSSSIAVVPARDNLDAVFASLAIKNQYPQKPVSLISPSQPDNLDWIANYNTFSNEVSAKSYIQIEFSEETTKTGEVKYESIGNKAFFKLYPKEGNFDPSDFKITRIEEKPDLIISLGIKSKEDLNSILETSDIRILNLDIDPENKFFGDSNAVDITSSSICELVAKISNHGKEIAKDAATPLLAGIYYQTSSLQDNTTFQTFEITSNLMDSGADHQLAIQKLFKTKDLSTIKLWGRILAKLKPIEDSRTVFAKIQHSDFEKTQSSPNQIIECIKDTINNSNDFDTLLIESEFNGQTNLYFAAHIDSNPNSNPIIKSSPKSNYRKYLIGSPTEPTSIEDFLNLI